MSALSSTTRRVLGGAAISAVLLGAGSGMAFAGDIDASGSGSPGFGDQSNNALAGDGADGGAGGDGTAGDAGDTDADTGVAADGGEAAGGDGGEGGEGGSVGANNPTQNANNQQQFCAVDQTATSTGADGTGADGGDDSDGGSGAGGNGGDISQTVNCIFNAYNQQGGAGSTIGVMDHGKKAADEDSDSHEGAKSSQSGSDSDSSDSDSDSDSDSASVSGDNTPVGAADTGDGSFLAASSSDLGDQVALGGAISAAALLAAYGVSIARRRVAAHQA